MKKLGQSIDAIRISSPCKISWSSMKGNEQIRFCEQCGRNVHNLSAMNRRQVKKIMNLSSNERICVGFNMDKDGAINIRKNLVSIGSLLNMLLAVFARIGTSLSIVLGILGSAFAGCADDSLKTTESIRQLGLNDLKPRKPAGRSR